MKTRRWAPSGLTWTIFIVTLATLAAALYTPTASWITSYNQASVVNDYAKALDHVEPDVAEQLALAREYNEALTYGVIVEAGQNIPLGTASQTDPKLDYWKMLVANDRGLMARVRIPSIDVDLPVYHGTSDEVLLEGAGHLQGSHLPIGGEGTRTVITAHRGLAGAVMFTQLDKVQIDDTFTVETFGEVLTYRVVNIQVVQPDETDTVKAEPGRDLATLITCTPLGLNTHRILVTGERVQPTPTDDLERAGGPSDLPHFPWWLIILILGLTLATWYLVWQGKKDATLKERARMRKAKATDAPAE